MELEPKKHTRTKDARAAARRSSAARNLATRSEMLLLTRFFFDWVNVPV